MWLLFSHLNSVSSDSTAPSDRTKFLERQRFVVLRELLTFDSWGVAQYQYVDITNHLMIHLALVQAVIGAWLIQAYSEWTKWNFSFISGEWNVSRYIYGVARLFRTRIAVERTDLNLFTLHNLSVTVSIEVSVSHDACVKRLMECF